MAWFKHEPSCEASGLLDGVCVHEDTEWAVGQLWNIPGGAKHRPTIEIPRDAAGSKLETVVMKGFGYIEAWINVTNWTQLRVPAKKSDAVGHAPARRLIQEAQID